MSATAKPPWLVTPEKVQAVVQQLIKAARPKKIILFGSYARGEVTRDAAFFQENWQSLALLTRSLPSAEQLKERCPAFHAHALTTKPTLEAMLEKSLREALTILAVGPTEIEPMPIWQQHLHLLVPSPDSGGSC